jgi:hypothetical protein
VENRCAAPSPSPLETAPPSSMAFMVASTVDTRPTASAAPSPSPLHLYKETQSSLPSPHCSPELLLSSTPPHQGTEPELHPSLTISSAGSSTSLPRPPASSSCPPIYLGALPVRNGCREAIFGSLPASRRSAPAALRSAPPAPPPRAASGTREPSIAGPTVQIDPAAQVKYLYTGQPKLPPAFLQKSP